MSAEGPRVTTQQIVLSLVLALLVFSIALDLKISDFRRVAQTPRAVIAGLLPQFVLFPGATWLATLALDLPPQVEAAMILVAVCPGGTTSSVITHLGGGNAALSVTLSAFTSLASLLLTPLNFSWMVATNPATASWLRSLAIDASAIWFTLMVLLALPLALGLAVAYRWPAFTARARKPLARLAIVALIGFILAGLVIQRQLLTASILPILLVVVLHNTTGLLMGHFSAALLRVDERDRRAVIIEGGLQNAGLALGIVAVQFNSDLQMVILISLWGVWHSVSALSLAFWWRRKDARAATLPAGSVGQG
jgi:BASS family bile acid:Na+ symporter